MVICVCNPRAEEKRRDGSPGLTSLFVQPNMWALIVKDCFRKEKEERKKSIGEWHLGRSMHGRRMQACIPSTRTEWPLLVERVALKKYTHETRWTQHPMVHILGLSIPGQGRPEGGYSPEDTLLHGTPVALQPRVCLLHSCREVALKALAMAYHFFHSQAKAICSPSTCHRMC